MNIDTRAERNFKRGRLIAKNAVDLPGGDRITSSPETDTPPRVIVRASDCGRIEEKAREEKSVRERERSS